MKTAILINEILESIVKLVKNIKTLFLLTSKSHSKNKVKM